MEDTNDRDMNFSENFVIISSRKTDFLDVFINKMKSENDKAITPNIIYIWWEWWLLWIHYFLSARRKSKMGISILKPP
jgi:hypothetical protein